MTLNTNEVKKEIKLCEKHLQAGLIESSGKVIQNIFIITGKAILTKVRNKQPLLSNNIRQGIRKGKPHKKWFDKECRFQKEKTNKLANKKNNNPQNNQIKQEHRSALKYYRQLCNSKKYIFWKNESSKLDNDLHSNDFWKTLRGHKPTKQKISNADGKRWENFFTNLYRNHIDEDIDDILTKSPQGINENLNKKISMEGWESRGWESRGWESRGWESRGWESTIGGSGIIP